MQEFDTDLYFKDPTFKRGSCSESLSMSESELDSASASKDAVLTHTQSCIPSQPGSEWAIWNASTGVYADRANQTGRFTTDSGVVTDSYTGLQWQAAGSSGTYNWSAAAAAGSSQAYCANLRLGECGSWRLPTLAEMQTLVDYTVSFPSIDGTVFLNTPTIIRTSTVDASNSNNVWSVNFNSGNTGKSSTSGVAYVHCVRFTASQEGVPVGRYTDEMGAALTSGSVQLKDIVTSLIWQRAFSGGGKIWSAFAAANSAQLYCNQLAIGAQGAGSWRLPTIKELRTLADVTVRSGAAINLVAFTNTPANSFWSSTIDQSNSAAAWLINFNGSGIVSADISFAYYVRCVR